METDDKHRFDGKEDKGYLQKPFDENNDGLPQIDNESARLAEEREDTKTFRENDPDKRGEAFPNVPDSDASSIEGEERPIDDSTRLTQYPEGND